MKTIKRNTNHRVIILVIIVLIILATCLTQLIISGQSAEQKKSITESKIDATNKKKFIESQSNNNQPAKSSSIKISAQTEANSSVTIFSNISNVSGGNCALNISNGSESYSANAEIIYQTEYSTCAGFSVPKESLSNGIWKISILITPTSGNSFQNTIDYEVSR